jgi:hypothetical protein
MIPRAPSWFVRALRSINRHFGVRWSGLHKAWEITEDVPWSRYEADLKGAPVFAIRRRPQPALRFSHLGSGCLDIVRRNDPRRFKDVQAMIDGLNIDKVHGLPVSRFI